jgi:hypothetical protein
LIHCCLDKQAGDGREGYRNRRRDPEEKETPSEAYEQETAWKSPVCSKT